MLHNTKSSGFTLIEVMVVLAIFGALMLMGLFFDFTFYRGTSFNTDVDVFASVLQRARARAINNINEADHGVYVDSDEYVLFQCSNPGCSYSSGRNPAFDQEISRNPGLGFGTFSEVVFTQLSGNSNFDGNIQISGYGKTASFSLNYEGLINR